MQAAWDGVTPERLRRGECGQAAVWAQLRPDTMDSHPVQGARGGLSTPGRPVGVRGGPGAVVRVHDLEAEQVQDHSRTDYNLIALWFLGAILTV